MPSDRILDQKKQYVSELAESLKSAQTVVLTEYLGLTVAQDTDLRNQLREAGVSYRVVKNRLGKLAVKQAGLDELEDIFVGSTAVAYSDDIIAPAKVLKKFAKTNQHIEIKGGASEGKVISLDELNALADVPDLPELYAKLVGSLVSPISGLAMLVKAIAEKAEEAGAETAADVYEGKKEDGEEVSTDEVEATAPVEEAEVESADESAEAPAEEVEETQEEAPAESAE